MGHRASSHAIHAWSSVTWFYTGLFAWGEGGGGGDLFAIGCVKLTACGACPSGGYAPINF